MARELICARCLIRCRRSWLSGARSCPHCGADALRRTHSRLGRLLVVRAAKVQRERILTRVREEAIAPEGEADPPLDAVAQ